MNSTPASIFFYQNIPETSLLYSLKKIFRVLAYSEDFIRIKRTKKKGRETCKEVTDVVLQ